MAEKVQSNKQIKIVHKADAKVSNQKVKSTSKASKVASSSIKLVTVKPKSPGLLAPIFDITGKSQGTLSLPKEIFGVKPNERLLAQAIRVYTTNIHRHTASTKTRGNVRGGGIKPWRQKGTGRARAGSKRSPLWVGGGIVFGPQARESKLALPQKMKHKALLYALSKQTSQGNIKVISSLAKLTSKTKFAAQLLEKIGAVGKTTFVISDKRDELKLATRNIPQVFVENAQDINAYKVLISNNIIFEKGAIEKIK